MSKTSAFKDLQKHWAKQAKESQKRQEQKQPEAKSPEPSEAPEPTPKKTVSRRKRTPE